VSGLSICRQYTRAKKVNVHGGAGKFLIKWPLGKKERKREDSSKTSLT
jgi:hypothetical protein